MRSCDCCKNNTTPSDDINAIARLLKLIGEPNRLRILGVLNNGKEHCVCEFEKHMPEVSQSLLSHHLADLKVAGLVCAEKRGKRVYYRLSKFGADTMELTTKIKSEVIG